MLVRTAFVRLILISIAALSCPPFTRAQIQGSSPLELPMTRSEAGVVDEIELQQPFLKPLSAPLLSTAQDLSGYREFEFGTNLLAVEKQTGMQPSDVKITHQHPLLMQELDWQPVRYANASSEADPVKGILFSFCNGELFRMAINYDRDKTDGLTAEDMIEAISANYGASTRPEEDILFPSLFNETVKIIARWEDGQSSLNLVRSSYQSNFGVVMFSKTRDAAARAAVIESMRLDELEAPRKEIERLKQKDEENRLQQDRARLVNKLNFRP